MKLICLNKFWVVRPPIWTRESHILFLILLGQIITIHSNLQAIKVFGKWQYYLSMNLDAYSSPCASIHIGPMIACWVT